MKFILPVLLLAAYSGGQLATTGHTDHTAQEDQVVSLQYQDTTYTFVSADGGVAWQGPVGSFDLEPDDVEPADIDILAPRYLAIIFVPFIDPDTGDTYFGTAVALWDSDQGEWVVRWNPPQDGEPAAPFPDFTGSSLDAVVSFGGLMATDAWSCFRQAERGCRVAQGGTICSFHSELDPWVCEWTCAAPGDGCPTDTDPGQ